MSKKTVVRSKYIPRSPMERSQNFIIAGRIRKISDHGIQITKRDSKARFWVDTDFFVDRNEISIEDSFQEGQEVKLSLIFNCFTSKNNEFTTKPHLADIEPIDSTSAWALGINNSDFIVNVKVNNVIPTQTPGLFILTGSRINSEGEEFERYIFRHFSKGMIQPEPGTYEVAFRLSHSSKIITNNGDIFFDEEEYTVVVDGVETKKRSLLYFPVLDAFDITPIIT